MGFVYFLMSNFPIYFAVFTIFTVSVNGKIELIELEVCSVLSNLMFVQGFNTVR